LKDSRRLSRDACLAELIFAARALAQNQITRLRGTEELVCSLPECRTKQTTPDLLEHTDNCAAGRVFRALDGLLSLPTLSTLGGAAVFHEPWSLDGIGVVRDGLGRMVTDQIGAELSGVDEDTAFMRRIVACVNHCAGMRTEDLEAMGHIAQRTLTPSTVVARA